MKSGQLSQGSVRAFVTQFYRDEVELLQKSVSEIDPKQLALHPVYFAFCRAYFECWRIIKESAEASIDVEVRIDKAVWRKVQELSPWVLFNRSSSAKLAHGTSLGRHLLGAGLDYPAAYKEIEDARKPSRGRPANCKAAIFALEMKLAGKTYVEIADFLGRTFPSSGYGDSAHRIDRIRKLIQSVKPIYEKYRSRN